MFSAIAKQSYFYTLSSLPLSLSQSFCLSVSKQLRFSEHESGAADRALILLEVVYERQSLNGQRPQRGAA